MENQARGFRKAKPQGAFKGGFKRRASSGKPAFGGGKSSSFSHQGKSGYGRNERAEFGGEKRVRPGYGAEGRNESKSGFGYKKKTRFGEESGERSSFGRSRGFGGRNDRPAFGRADSKKSAYGFAKRVERAEVMGGEKSDLTKKEASTFENSSEKNGFGGERRERSSFGERRGERSGFGRRGGFGGGRSGFGGRRGPMQKSKRLTGTTIRVDQLINKVDAERQFAEQKIEIKHRFSDFALDERLLKNITDKGYTTPTPIQDQSIPLGLEGRDVIGVANTGTGKTAAFLLPLINKVLLDRNQKVLVMAPTRELAQQIMDELIQFVRGLGIQAVLCIGGAGIFQQARMIKTPFNFLVGTPGRIIDLYERKMLHLDRFQNVVLDEADRMVDMGFINDMKLILGKLAKTRQSYFYTATLEAKIEDLIQQFLSNPIKVSVKTRETAHTIEQDIIEVPKDLKAKAAVLADLVSQPDFGKAIVFGRTKHAVEKIAKFLLGKAIRVDYIHGDKKQNQRLKTLEKFKKGEVQVLIATDIAARGLDIRDVAHVINFDLPANYEDYVHRIGRTGRAEQKGKAITFVSH